MFTTVVENYISPTTDKVRSGTFGTNQIFTSFKQIATGLLWSFHRTNNEIYYQSLWANNRPSDKKNVPFQTPIVPNSDLIKTNWYRSTTEFFNDVLWAEPPVINNMDAVERDLFVRAFEQASRWRSIKGYGVVRYEPNTKQWVALDTSFWHPVFNPMATNEVIGHIIAYPWVANYDPSQGNPLPDRLTIIEIQPAVTLRKTFVLSGMQLGILLTEEEIPSPDLIVFGNGISDYTDIIDLVDELENRLTRASKTLDTHGNPHIQGPATAVDPSTGKFVVNPEGGYLPRDIDDPEYRYLTWDAQYQYNQNHINRLIDMIYIATKLPATAFGLSDRSSQTGNARERQLFAALKKVQRLRRNIDVAIQPHGIELSWADQPFSSFTETVNLYTSLVTAGIITAVEAKERIYGSA